MGNTYGPIARCGESVVASGQRPLFRTELLNLFDQTSAQNGHAGHPLDKGI